MYRVLCLNNWYSVIISILYCATKKYCKMLNFIKGKWATKNLKMGHLWPADRIFPTTDLGYLEFRKYSKSLIVLTGFYYTLEGIRLSVHSMFNHCTKTKS